MVQSLLIGCLILAVCFSLDPIVLKGNQLYNSRTKERFYVKGVAYSPDLYANTSCGGTAVNSIPGEDHFSDDKEPLWSKDIPLLQALGINSVRLYNIDPGKNHDKFMLALEKAGIYAVVSSTVTVGPGVLDASKAAVASPAGAGCYTTGLLYSAKLIVRQFAKYNNTLAFVVANEIGQYEDNEVLKPGYHAIPCVKALVRDLRAYMRLCSCGMRYIPLMYAATDLLPQSNGAKPRDLISQYLTCGEHAVDLYGVNIYTWCAYASTFDKLSTYKDVTEAYASYDVGMVLSEYGCTYGQFENYYPFTDDPTQTAKTSQRTWKQIDVLFSKNMSDVFSGGFAYQYSMSEIIYGMVLLPGYERNQPDIKLLPNYEYAKQHFTAVVPPMEIGTWDDKSLCTWKPPVFATKVKNTCPSKAQAELLFGGSKFPETENWSGGMIPPVPPNSFVDCLAYPLSDFDKAENACRGECTCAKIRVEPRCSVDWSRTNMSLPQNVDGVTKLFDRLCGLLYHQGDEYSQTCTDDFAPNGKYAGCTSEQRANYLLGLWYDYKKQTECCASFFLTDSCTQPLEAGVTAPDAVLWRGKAVFSVQVNGGLPPYHFQWQYAAAGSDTFASGSNGTTFEIAEASSEMTGGRIRCQVWDSAFLSGTSVPVTVTVMPPYESRNVLTGTGTAAEFSANLALVTKVIATTLLADQNLSKVLRMDDVTITDVKTGNITTGNASDPISFAVVVRLGGPSEGSAKKIQDRLEDIIEDGTLNSALVSDGLALKVVGSAAVCGPPPPAGKNQIATCSKSSPDKKQIDVCTVQCAGGYVGSGSATYSCQNGGWSRNMFLCAKEEESSSGVPLWLIVVLVVLGLLLLGAGFKIFTNYRENQQIKNYQLKKGLIND